MSGFDGTKYTSSNNRQEYTIQSGVTEMSFVSISDSEWVTLRARGSDRSWFTPDEAVAAARAILNRYDWVNQPTQTEQRELSHAV